MKVNERVFLVQQASSELTKAMVEIEDKYELTVAETMQILIERLQTMAHIVIRGERAHKGSVMLETGNDEPQD